MRLSLLRLTFFSFIAKEEKGEKHTCYVFVSDKLVSGLASTKHKPEK
jgi:hypothetical protein